MTVTKKDTITGQCSAVLFNAPRFVDAVVSSCNVRWLGRFRRSAADLTKTGVDAPQSGALTKLRYSPLSHKALFTSALHSRFGPNNLLGPSAGDQKGHHHTSEDSNTLARSARPLPADFSNHLRRAQRPGTLPGAAGALLLETT